MGSENMTGTIKKNRLIGLIKGIGLKIYEVFKDYPVTMLGIIVAALLGAILEEVYNNNTEEILEKIMVFCLITSGQTIMYEEVFKKKIPVRVIGSIVSAIISFVFVMIFSHEGETLWGADTDLVSETAVRFLCPYLTVLIGLAIYHMFKRLEQDFEVYCTKAFLELIRATVVYFLFAVGLGIIVFIFNELIYDTDDFIWQLELFLAGGIYVPMCLKAISGKNERPGKFARLCIMYVMQSMLLIAFLIIYVYIVKLFISDETPSNSVFGILAFLFSIGMPVWTLIHGVIREDQGSKFSEYIPFLFVPFVLLQCWSMGIRIKAYGITTSRYFGIVLIIGEIIYITLYVLQMIKKKDFLSKIIFVIMILTVFSILIPATNFQDAVIRSQTKRLEELLSKEHESESMKSAIYSAYNAIERAGYKGEKTLEIKYTREQMKEIEGYSGYRYYDPEVYVYSKKCELDDLDVSGFKKITYVVGKPGNAATCYLYRGNTETNRPEFGIMVDLSGYVQSIIDDMDHKETQFSLQGREIIKIDDNTSLYIRSLEFRYNENSMKVSQIELNGYLLER